MGAVIEAATRETTLNFPKIHVPKLINIFFHIQSIKKMVDKKRVLVLVNFEHRQHESCEDVERDHIYHASNLTTVLKTLPPEISYRFSENYASLLCSTEFYINEIPLIKEARIYDSYWELWVYGKKVDLTKASVNNAYKSSHQAIEVMVRILQQIKPCVGKRDSTAVINRDGYVTEELIRDDSGVSRTLRSKYCAIVLGWFAKTDYCKTCASMTRLSSCPASDKEMENTT